MELSEAQYNAITHFNGPCLCIAGPGSGKTLVLTKRISYLIRERGVQPDNILVVTFTRDAAMSMKQRFMKECDVRPVPAFGTFHSVFFNILRKEGQISATDIISGRRALAILSHAVSECGIRPFNDNFYPALIRTVSYYKNCGILDENIFPSDITTDDVRKIIATYDRSLREGGFYDFDDILSRTLEYFNDHPDRLKAWQDRFKYILVDEAQDMNSLQYRLITEIASPRDNLFLVGDDDQAIYGFRGSDPQFLLDFTNDHKSSQTIVLNSNYRCDTDIVCASSALIMHNSRRFTKNLISSSKDTGSIEVITSADDREEADKVTGMIKQLLDTGVSPAEIAVLYRNRGAANALFTQLSKTFRLNTDSEKSFYMSFVFTDIISILKSTEPRVYRSDFYRALTHPERNIGRMGLKDEIIDRREWLKYMKNTIMSEDAGKFCQDLDFISRLSPYSAISYIMKRMGYEKYISDHAYRNGTDGALYTDTAEHLMEVSRKYRRIDEFCRAMTEQKERLSEAPEKKSEVSEIGLYTFHGSKGLEFSHVFMIAACDGITPSDKADTLERIEEERRMFYVAMTRARHHLVISLAARYGSRTYYPSPFIKEALG